MVLSEAWGATISSPSLRQVAGHWDLARGTRSMPAWRDISPAAIVKQLPIVWSYRYDSEQKDFFGRLAGERISELFGRPFSGLPLREAYPKEDYDRLFARCKRVMESPALYHGSGMVFRHLDRFGLGERIMMPLATDGVKGDGIFGATDYPYVRHQQPLIDCDKEAESWFAL